MSKYIKPNTLVSEFNDNYHIDELHEVLNSEENHFEIKRFGLTGKQWKEEILIVLDTLQDDYED